MKLNQIIAVEKEAKSRTYAQITELHKQSKKLSLFDGFFKLYLKKDESGEDYPPEKQNVQCDAEAMTKQLAALAKPLYDLEASKEASNAVAKADVVVAGKVLVANVPVTFLLFLEKQLNDVRTFIEALPVLDPAEIWAYDTNSNCYKSEMRQTHRTKKIQKSIVLYPATPEHPAQAQLITEDEVVGYWNFQKQSGAFSPATKSKMLMRIDAVSKAVKIAREQANDSEVIPMTNVGAAIFDYILT